MVPAGLEMFEETSISQITDLKNHSTKVIKNPKVLQLFYLATIYFFLMNHPTIKHNLFAPSPILLDIPKAHIYSGIVQ